MAGDLREILKEAMAAGMAAREARTAELREKARREGLRKADRRGWCWMDVDPETCRSVMLLGMAGTRVTFRIKPPGFVAEDTSLYLDNVSSYKRFEASMAGIKAAAEVLRRHGIQAKENGMPDEKVE